MRWGGGGDDNKKLSIKKKKTKNLIPRFDYQPASSLNVTLSFFLSMQITYLFLFNLSLCLLFLFAFFFYIYIFSILPFVLIPLRVQSSGTHRRSSRCKDSCGVRTRVPISGAYLKEPFYNALCPYHTSGSRSRLRLKKKKIDGKS